MRTIQGLTFASTALDGHGEQYDKQFLLDLMASLPRRMPLNRHHDVGLPTVGYLEASTLRATAGTRCGLAS